MRRVDIDKLENYVDTEWKDQLSSYIFCVIHICFEMMPISYSNEINSFNEYYELAQRNRFEKLANKIAIETLRKEYKI